MKTAIVLLKANCNYTKTQLQCNGLNLGSKSLKFLEDNPPEDLNVVVVTNGHNVTKVPPYLYTLKNKPFLLVLKHYIKVET